MLSDKEILTDCLASQKHVARDYLACAEHVDDPQLLQVLMNLCAEEQHARLQIYQAMHQRGWYNPQPISPQQVQQAQQQFNQVRQQLQNGNSGYTQTSAFGFGQQAAPSWSEQARFPQ